MGDVVLGDIATTYIQVANRGCIRPFKIYIHWMTNGKYGLVPSQSNKEHNWDEMSYGWMASWWIVSVDNAVLGFRVARKKYCSYCSHRPTNWSTVMQGIKDWFSINEMRRGRGPYEEALQLRVRIWIRFPANQTATRVEYYPRVLFQGSCECTAQHPRNYLVKQHLICAPQYAGRVRPDDYVDKQG